MFESIAGIPAHPLFVHAAVVAVPVAAIVAIVAALRMRGDHPLLRLWAMLLSAGALVSVIIAKSSGEAMLPGMGLSEDNPGKVGEHAMWATYSVLITGVLFVVTALLWFLFRSRAKKNALGLIVRILVVIVAVAALFLVIQTGHEGAMLVWLED